ncbi:MAG: hypothetical protein WD708_00585 [Kiritimatiellia bacterium]
MPEKSIAGYWNRIDQDETSGLVRVLRGNALNVQTFHLYFGEKKRKSFRPYRTRVLTAAPP